MLRVISCTLFGQTFLLLSMGFLVDIVYFLAGGGGSLGTSACHHAIYDDLSGVSGTPGRGHRRHA